MARHIISSDGLAMIADNEDIYTVILGSDGHDYMVELQSGLKVWKIYNSSSIMEETSIVSKDAPLVNNDDINIIPLVSYHGKKKPGRKPKVKDIISCIDDVKPSLVVEQKMKLKIVKKELITNVSGSHDLQNETIKKIIKKKDDGVHPNIQKDEPTKKISPYHTFIKMFLQEHSEIVWNERMKAANDAWNENKKSK